MKNSRWAKQNAVSNDMERTSGGELEKSQHDRNETAPDVQPSLRDREPIRRSQFTQRVVDVILHRLLGDIQTQRNLFVGQTLA